MDIGTVALSKYFNGGASIDESTRYQRTLAENFDVVGMFAFGQMPFFTQKGPDPDTDYDWSTIDRFVGFGDKYNVKLHYNTVINHAESVPDWFNNLSPSQKTAAFERHVRAVIRRYKDKFAVYKLVNEVYYVEEENYLGTNQKRVDLITKIFQWAKDEYSEGVYMLNDHIPFLDKDAELRPKYVDLIKRLKDKGAPIDIIGVQGHLGYRPIAFQLPPDEATVKTLHEIHEAGKLPIYITEFEISYRNCKEGRHFPGCEMDPTQPFTDQNGKKFANWFEYQAYAYKHFYDLVAKEKYIKGLIYWGFYDKDFDTNPHERPGVGFFNDHFQPKPVYNAMLDIFNTK